MELTLNNNEIVSCRCTMERIEKQTLDMMMNLPDYCSDIKRIIKCVVEPGISGVSVTGGRACAAGEITVRLIYVNDREEIDCFADSSAFSVSAQLGELSDYARYTAQAAVDFVNPRAVSERRFSVNGAVSVLFRVYTRETQSIVCGVEGCGCQKQTQTLKQLNLLSMTEKTFDLSETLEIPENEMPVSKILFSNADLKLDSKKAVSGKLLLRGELELDLLCLADGEDHTVFRLTHSLPVSQIVEAENVDENSLTSVDLRLQMLQLRPRADASGNGRLLDIAAKVSAMIEAYGETEQTVITDCFATVGAIKSEMKEVEFCGAMRDVSLSAAQKMRVQLGEQNASQILELRVLQTQCVFRQTEEKDVFHCGTDLAILLKNSEDQISYCERKIEFDLERDTQGEAQMQATPVLRITDLRGTLLGGEAEITFQSAVSAQTFETRRETVCVAVEPDEGASADRSALTLYFSQKGETVWDIAKHYATSCDAIRAENDLRGDVLTEDKMLLVPCV